MEPADFAGVPAGQTAEAAPVSAAPAAAARESAALLRANMFWQQNHRLVFEAILRVTQRGDDPDLSRPTLAVTLP